MKIIISPAKNMNTDTFLSAGLPTFLEETSLLMEWIRALSYEEAKELWRCNDRIAGVNYDRFQKMELYKALTPALVSYEGIQYQYMAPEVFTQKEWDYAQRHLRILSGFYGVLKPLDGVAPYRLEMQAKVCVGKAKDLYEFWGDKLYGAIQDEDGIILNLASKEYSKCIERYLKPEDTYITCIFGEWKDGKAVQKGTQAKMARGEMVRFMAEAGITRVGDIRKFDLLGYHYEERLSSGKEYVFCRNAVV